MQEEIALTARKGEIMKLQILVSILAGLLILAFSVGVFIVAL